MSRAVGTEDAGGTAAKRAKILAKQLQKKNPGYVILYNLLGSSFLNLNQFENAKIYFKEGLKLEPNNIALLNNLGMTYKNLLEYKLATEIFLEIINKNSSYVNAYVNLGNLKRDINWKIDNPFNFNNARLASVRGKVNKNLPPIANRIAIKINPIIIKILRPFDIFFDEILLINFKRK